MLKSYTKIDFQYVVCTWPKYIDFFWILLWQKYFMDNIWADTSCIYSLLTNSHTTERFVKAPAMFLWIWLERACSWGYHPQRQKADPSVPARSYHKRERERKKYQHEKPENELYLWGDSEHGAAASKRLIWHILTLQKQDKNNVRPYNQKEESKGEEGWGSFEVSVFAYDWVSSQGAS